MAELELENCVYNTLSKSAEYYQNYLPSDFRFLLLFCFVLFRCFCYDSLPIFKKVMQHKNSLQESGGGGQGGLNLPLPVPFNPGSRPVFVGSRSFACFRLQNIAQCCVIFPFFLPLPATLGILLPAPSSPASRTPPAPLSPGLPPPCRPPSPTEESPKRTNRCYSYRQ